MTPTTRLPLVDARWDAFLPLGDRLLRKSYIMPWCKKITFDHERNGFFVMWDMDHKNTVSDPRDGLK